MAFSKKTWKDRVSQYINRRLLTDSDGNTQQVTVTRDEGSVTEAGDAFSASNMNDLEDRIEDAFDGLTAADIPYSAGVSVADKLDNVPTFDTLTTSDNNKLLGVSVSGSDISVGAVDILPISNLLKVEKFSKSYTVSANSRTNFDDSFITVPSGYTLVGVISFASNVTGVLFQAIRPNTGYGSYSFELYNLNGATSSGNCDVYVLFVKNGYI